MGSAELQLGSAAATAAATAAAVGAPQVPTPLPEVPLSAGSSRRASGRPPKQEPTSSRVVADQVVSGGDIDWYFDQLVLVPSSFCFSVSLALFCACICNQASRG